MLEIYRWTLHIWNCIYGLEIRTHFWTRKEWKCFIAPRPEGRILKCELWTIKTNYRFNNNKFQWANIPCLLDCSCKKSDYSILVTPYDRKKTTVRLSVYLTEHIWISGRRKRGSSHASSVHNWKLYVCTLDWFCSYQSSVNILWRIYTRIILK